MKLIESSVRFPVTVIVGVLLAALFGVIAILRIPLQMAPTVDRPQITVTTHWEGAAPREVEEEITDKLEEKLNSAEGLAEISSTSEDGQSTINLTYDWGTNKDIARLDVSEKIGLVGDLPEDADEPIIQATNSDEETPIGWIAVKCAIPVNEARVVGEDVMKPLFERVEGVGTVWFYGGEEREVHVVLDTDALAARGIPITTVRDALRRENRNVKAGGLNEGKARYVVRTIGQFTRLADVEETVVGWSGGTPVYVRDVGKVTFGHKDKIISVHNKGEISLVFGILRKTGANSVEVMERVREVIATLNAQYSAKGITLDLVYDETGYIHDAISLLLGNLVYGAALAAIVLLLFLRSVVPTLIVAVSIPISVTVTFIFLQLFGRSLNIISLAGLAFATGMVVDNAIVVLENVFRHAQMGKSRLRAAYDGTKEVWGAVLSSTLTTLAVFIPILFVQQESGQLFRDIAITLSVSIGFSLLVSITVIPMFSSRFLKVKRRRPFEFVARGGMVLVNGITAAVAFLTASFLRKTVATVVIVGVSLVLAAEAVPPLDYLPQGNREMVFGLLETPPGFNVDQMEAILDQVEHRVLARPEVKHMFAVALPDNPIFGIIIKPEYSDKETMRKLVTEFQMMLMMPPIPGVVIPLTFQVPLFASRGGFLAGDLEITVRGPDLDTIQALAGRIMGMANGIREEAGFTSILPSFEVGKPEMQIRTDREKAAAVGLAVSDVGYLVGTMVDGTLAGTFRDKGKEIDISLMGPERLRAHTQEVLRAPVVTPTGRLILLGDVAGLDIASGPAKIEHDELERSAKVVIRVDPLVPLEQARKVLEEKVVDPVRASLPGLDYTVTLVGKARDLDQTWDAVKGSFVLAVIIVFLLMASLFESFTIPLVVILSVPLGLTGGLYGVAIARAFDLTVKLDVITMLGFVILVGTVVNGAILIVHQALNNIRGGMSEREGLIESVRTRVRPIFMSTLTSVFAMIPLVVSSGSGTELYRGLGAVVTGGLLLSTVFTLFLIPCVFSLFLSIRGRLMKLFGLKSYVESLREVQEFHIE
ncbi:MAG: efflux RND transporter permease subunit [Planctomycetes bacterium]|jgi:HAE1 family hydrophobic/amphiphilic exporter-1|nr:efflux RND transporter permease subunit [Planctomycetota bacterium]